MSTDTRRILITTIEKFGNILKMLINLCEAKNGLMDKDLTKKYQL